MSTYRGLNEKFDSAYEIKRQLRTLREQLDTSAPPLNLSAVTVQDIRSGAIPPAPTNFTATPGPGVIALTWTGANISNLSHYTIQVSTNPAFADASTFNTTNSFWTFDEGDVGTTYFFRVRAVNTEGNPSVYTSTVSAIPTSFLASETPGLPGSLELLDSLEFGGSVYDSDTRLGDVTFSATYSVLQIELVDVVPATDAVDLYMTFDFDGTEKSSQYRYMIGEFSTGGNFYARSGANTQAQIKFTQTGALLGTGTAESISGTIWLFTNPVLNASQEDPVVIADLLLRDSGGETTRYYSGGKNNNSADTHLTGFRIYPSSSNFASGRIRIYGWKLA